MRRKFICPRCETFVETDIDVDGYAVCPKCENDIYLPYFRETSLQSRVEELEAQLAEAKADLSNTREVWNDCENQLAARDALIERLVEAGHLLCDYAILVSVDHPIGDGQMAINDKAAWEALVAEYRASKDGGGK